MTEQPIVCPICADHNTHLDQVAILTPHWGSMTLTGQGEDAGCVALVHAGQRVGAGRRHTIEIEGRCESGHTWRWSWRQDKGATLFTQEQQ